MTNLNRRSFLQGVGASGAAVAATGCGIPGIENVVEPRVPIENVLPYMVSQPEQITPGLATFFNTKCNGCSAGCGVMAKVREGRVIKLEGNPDHPVSRGKLCSVGQQELQATYLPDRFDGPLNGGAATTWDDAVKAVAGGVQKARSAGKQVVYLGRPQSGSVGSLITQFVGAAGGKRLYWSPMERDALRTATQQLYGTAAEPRFDLAPAHTIVTFGAEFMGNWDLRLQRGWADSRDPKKGGFISRTVAVSHRLNNSSAVADLQLKAVPGTEAGVAMALAKLVAGKRNYSGPASAALASVDPAALAGAAGVSAERLEEIAGWMAEHAAVALPGATAGAAGTALATAVLLLNEVSGAVGKTMRFDGSRNVDGLGTYADVLALVADMKAGKVGVLLMDDLDLAYLLPAAAGAADALNAVDTVVAFTNSPNDSLVSKAIVLPPGTNIEAWGDAEAWRGVFTLQQPAMRSTKDIRQMGDVLLAVAQSAGIAVAPPAEDGAEAAPVVAPVEGEEPAPEALSLPDLNAASYREYQAAWWKAVVWDKAGRPGDFQTFWTDALQRGGVYVSDAFSASLTNPAAPSTAPATPDGSGLILTAFTHPFILDGRHADKPWAQEVPEPLSSYTWGTWVEMHPETAEKMGLKETEWVEVSTDAGSIKCGLFTTKTIHKDCAAVVLGNGHKSAGRYAGFGENPVQLFSGDGKSAGGDLALATRAQVKGTGEKTTMYQYIGNKDLDGRGVNFAVSKDDLGGHGGPASIIPMHHVPVDKRLTDAGLNDMYPEPDHPSYRFALVVDNNRCTGCGACETACFAENNIPVVGPEQISKARHMGWIRLSRYFEGDGEENPDVRFQMNVCQQCSHAPCEGVCPVLATYHNLDGLNAMVYNRCVGTRYCANNCPYTARRFNYHTYRWPESFNLMLNPDIVTREMGVMEKCTFCVHRLRTVKDEWRDEGKLAPASALLKLTACAQACPSDALTFGNVRDPDSPLQALYAEPRTYAMLSELNTKPGVRYMARINHTASELHHGGGHGGGHGGDHGDAAHGDTHGADKAHGGDHGAKGHDDHGADKAHGNEHDNGHGDSHGSDGAHH